MIMRGEKDIVIKVARENSQESIFEKSTDRTENSRELAKKWTNCSTAPKGWTKRQECKNTYNHLERGLTIIVRPGRWPSGD